MSAAAIHDPTHAYRRDARKLRGRFADRPLELYRSLRQLSDHYDQLRRFRSSEPVPVSPSCEFANEVREFLYGGMLTYSARQKLLKSAECRDIPRFEANLIIAAVQHRVSIRCSDTNLNPRPVSRWVWLGAIIFSQLALIIAIWALAVR